MSNELTIFENTLRPLTPHFEQALGRAMPVERLMRTIMISVERTPKLLAANRQTLFNAAMSAACLGLEVDGVTGQAFLVPFAGKVQLIVGYKGYNTLGARAGLTITGEVVRDGDAFDYDLGEGYVTHKPKLGNQGPIIAAWAKAAARDRPPIVAVLGIDDLMAIMARSPAVKGGFDTPWKEKIIGFPAMCSKSVKRRLARSTPLNVMQVAAAMEEAHEERGKLSWIDPARGIQIEGEFNEDGPTIRHEQRSTHELISVSSQAGTLATGAAAPDLSQPPETGAADYINRYRIMMMNATNAADGAKIGTAWNAEKKQRDMIKDWPPGSFEELQAAVKKAISELTQTALIGN